MFASRPLIVLQSSGYEGVAGTEICRLKRSETDPPPPPALTDSPAYVKTSDPVSTPSGTDEKNTVSATTFYIILGVVVVLLTVILALLIYIFCPRKGIFPHNSKKS